MSEQPDRYELRARQLRILAGLHRKRAAELEKAAEAALASRSMRASPRCSRRQRCVTLLNIRTWRS